MSKINDALTILTALGMPRAQLNERSALTLLALLQLEELGSWQDLKSPMLGVRAIMDFCRNVYFKPYAENSRESFRKETLHQFVAAALAVQNPDDPTRAPNSPKWCYQISREAFVLLTTFGTPAWQPALQAYLSTHVSLAESYRKARDFHLVECVLPNGASFSMSPGGHSQLIRDVIEQFAPRFAPGARVAYVGDTGNKGVIHDEVFLQSIGISAHERGKMPDAILYLAERNWLYLVEAVTSVGPVDGKRHKELTELFGGSTAGLVFVTAFPSRELMAKFLPFIAWETEVWCAADVTHLIHFNGDRFMGPHT